MDKAFLLLLLAARNVSVAMQGKHFNDASRSNEFIRSIRILVKVVDKMEEDAAQELARIFLESKPGE